MDRLCTSVELDTYVKQLNGFLLELGKCELNGTDYVRQHYDAACKVMRTCAILSKQIRLYFLKYGIRGKEVQAQDFVYFQPLVDRIWYIYTELGGYDDFTFYAHRVKTDMGNLISLYKVLQDFITYTYSLVVPASDSVAEPIAASMGTDDVNTYVPDNTFVKLFRPDSARTSRIDVARTFIRECLLHNLTNKDAVTLYEKYVQENKADRPTNRGNKTALYDELQRHGIVTDITRQAFYGYFKR